MIIRKLGKTLRGQVKPYQIVTAAVLGALIGFAPPFASAPLYLIGVILLLAVINANFFIATGTAALCKLIALALMPVSFELGLVLVDGPLQPLFKTLINAPVTALMGFDFYVTSGGAVLALVVGTLLGVGYLKLISGFRKKMAQVESDSDRYNAYVSKRSVRILMWVLFGGKAKMSYTEIMEQKKIGNPVRPLGIALAVLVVALLVVLQQFASGPMITTLLKGQLEQFHGATVDVDGVDIDLASGKLTVTRLAMADPDNLETDLIRANELTAKLSTTDLLRKRITIDSIVVDDAVQGEKRDRPGVLIGSRREPSPPSEEGKSIDEWFDKAKVWKDRLDTFRDWLEKLKGPPEDEQANEEEERDRLREWADRYGHADVRAAHLVEGSPSVLVKDTKINKLRATWPDEETLDIHATNLSTHPALAPDKPRITVKSSEQTFDMAISLAPAAMADSQSDLKLTLKNQSIDQTLQGLELPGDISLKGGTWQTGINGNWSDMSGLDLPLTLVLQNTSFVWGSSNTPIDQFPLQFGVVGPMDSPSLDIDAKAFLASVKQTGSKVLLNQLKTAGADQLKDAIGEGLGDSVGGALQGILGGGDKDNDEQEESEGEEEQPDVTDRLREGLGGLLDRGGDDE